MLVDAALVAFKLKMQGTVQQATAVAVRFLLGLVVAIAGFELGLDAGPSSQLLV